MLIIETREEKVNGYEQTEETFTLDGYTFIKRMVGEGKFVYWTRKRLNSEKAHLVYSTQESGLEKDAIVLAEEVLKLSKKLSSIKELINE